MKLAGGVGIVTTGGGFDGDRSYGRRRGACHGGRPVPVRDLRESRLPDCGEVWRLRVLRGVQRPKEQAIHHGGALHRRAPRDGVVPGGVGFGPTASSDGLRSWCLSTSPKELAVGPKPRRPALRHREGLGDGVRRRGG